ncbi:MAG: glycosyltransferase family 4 protein [Ignavibacterium sp.]|nr:MAG: glycosyltransferase family 4 protein [Ignavibacterium sp.]
MKIVHAGTSDLNGGAAIASLRISSALNKMSVSSKLLVHKKVSNDPQVESIISNSFEKIGYYSRFLLDESLIRTLTVSDRGRFSFPFYGADVSSNKLINEADILNLHWINGGYLSLNSLAKLSGLNKPIVWTLHDMWAFTGGCHYNLDCEKFIDRCNTCPALKLKSENDFSAKIFHRKKDILNSLNITIVTCSSWLAEEAGKSSTLKGKNIIVINNPIHTKVFKPIDQDVARKEFQFTSGKFLLLIGAMNLKDKRKGFNHLLDALKFIYEKYSDLRYRIELITFGKPDKSIENGIPFRVHNLGTIPDEEKLRNLYNACDLYVAPSIQDNLPNTVLESISCGTPVVAFNTGGIPDMIEHLKNGYLATLQSSEDLAEGIVLLLTKPDLLQEMKAASRERAVEYFNEEYIAKKYIELYKSIL